MSPYHTRPGFFQMQAEVRETARYLDNMLKPIGLTNVQAFVMLNLQQSPNITLSKHAKYLGMDRTTLRACTKKLIARGLVEEYMTYDDRRVSILRLSSDGKKLLKDAIPIMKRVDSTIAL